MGQQGLTLLDFPTVEVIFSCMATAMVQVLAVPFPPLFPSIGSQLEKLLSCRVRKADPCS